jgi:hypothetical protein
VQNLILKEATDFTEMSIDINNTFNILSTLEFDYYAFTLKTGTYCYQNANFSLITLLFLGKKFNKKLPLVSPKRMIELLFKRTVEHLFFNTTGEKSHCF